MDERVIQFRVGVLVVATAIIAGILVILFESQPLIQGQYTVFVRFTEAPGVAVGTPVRKSGILIGRVSQVELTDEGKVTVTTRIDSKFRLRRNEACRISTSAILGDAVMEFIPGRDLAVEETYLNDGDLIQGMANEDPFRMIVSLQGEVSHAVRSINQAGDEVYSLAQNANKIVARNTDQMQRILDKSEVALERFGRAMATVDEFVGDPEIKNKLKRTLSDFPELLAESRRAVTEARTMFDGMNRMSQRAENNLRNLEGFTKPLGERGDRIVANLENSVKSIDRFLGELVEFSQSLNSGEGTLGRLVHDDELYQRVEIAVQNIQDVSRELKPILHNANVFTDKIARDPSRLGLKGALDRQPTGLK